MFHTSENFDIADLKRSSVKMKGALQAEWQEVSKVKGPAPENSTDVGAVDFNDDQSRAFLPRIDLTLKLNGNFKTVSYVPTLSSMQGQNNQPVANFNPLSISQWEGGITAVPLNSPKC